MYKFRTMTDGAHLKEKELAGKAGRSFLKLKNDPRITAPGDARALANAIRELLGHHARHFLLCPRTDQADIGEAVLAEHRRELIMHRPLTDDVALEVDSFVAQDAACFDEIGKAFVRLVRSSRPASTRLSSSRTSSGAISSRSF
jgi:hypothetical protein